MRLVRVYYNPRPRYWSSTLGTGLLVLTIAFIGTWTWLADGADAPEWVVTTTLVAAWLVLLDSVVLTAWFQIKHGKRRRAAYRAADDAWVRRDLRAFIAAVEDLDGYLDSQTRGRLGRARAWVAEDER